MIHRVHLTPVLQMNHRTLKIPAKSIQARPLRTVRRRWSLPYTIDLDAREPETQELTSDALITYLADRARDRHAREDMVNGVPFRRYDHYLPFYWEQRIANLEIIDRVAVGGSGITFNFTTLAQLNPAEFRTFYANGAAVYHNNMSDYLNAGVELTSVQPSVLYPGETEYTYSALISNKSPENRPLQLGDRIEIELSQFLLAPRNGRSNYYGTAILYVVGEGIVPWYAQAKEQATSETEREYASFDSLPTTYQRLARRKHHASLSILQRTGASL